MEKKKRNELYMIAGILVFALLLWAASLLIRRPGAMVEVSVDGAVIEEFPLDQDLDFVIHTSNGGTNYLCIKDGQASITEASCPDKICVRKGAIREKGEEPIVCLPNRVVVTVR